MRKIIIIFAFSFMIAMGGCKKCGNQDAGGSIFSLELGEYEKNVFLGKKSKLRIQIPFMVIPHPEADKDMQFKISSISFVKGNGRLLGRGDEEIGAGYQMNPGENILTYEPNKLGGHTIRIEVSDGGDEAKQSAMISFQVEEKKVPFEMQLTKVREQGQVSDKEWIFPYQGGKLRLAIAGKSVEASKLAYKVKSLHIEKGSLLTSSRNELKEGDNIELGEHNLVFVAKEEGSAKIEIEIENEEHASKRASVSFDIKPVEFDLISCLHIVEAGTGEQAELSIHIPATGNEGSEVQRNENVR
jgi:hypothetical protein